MITVGKDSGKSKKLPSEIETIDFCFMHITKLQNLWQNIESRKYHGSRISLPGLSEASVRSRGGLQFPCEQPEFGCRASYKIDEKLFVKGKMSSLPN